MVVNLLLNVLLIPPLGVAGAALATAVSYALSLGVALLMRPQVVPLSGNLMPMLLHGVVVSGLVTSVIVFGPQEPVGRALAGVGAGVVVVVLAFLFKVLDHATLKAEWRSR